MGQGREGGRRRSRIEDERGEEGGGGKEWGGVGFIGGALARGSKTYPQEWGGRGVEKRNM